jgi:hypothetical protein
LGNDRHLIGIHGRSSTTSVAFRNSSVSSLGKLAARKANPDSSDLDSMICFGSLSRLTTNNSHIGSHLISHKAKPASVSVYEFDRGKSETE